MMDLTPLGRMLHEEHLRTLEVMNRLETRLVGEGGRRPLDAAVDEDRRMLRDLTAVVDNDVDRHFAFEETVLFPLLAEAGAEDMTRLLTQEHAAMRPISTQLRGLAQGAMDEAFDAGAWDEFRILAIELVERVMFHIQKEEMGLVHGLPHFLDPDIDRDLATRYAEFAG